MALAVHGFVALLVVCLILASMPAEGASVRTQVGRPADVASSAYLYRADRSPDANPPEAWILLMQHLGLSYSAPIGPTSPGVAKVLCGLLWEEVRPIRSIQLTWPANAAKLPSPADLVVTYFDTADDTAHTWWNPRVVKQADAPRVSPEGRTFTYAIPVDTWGVVVTVRGSGKAAGWAVPEVRALVPDVCKRAEIEIEWCNARKDYSGEVTGYDAVLGPVRPLPGAVGTKVTGPRSWASPPSPTGRRGIRMEALYIGASRWRRVWPYSAQPEDVARSLVTVRTKAGGFTFNVADLEQGPIYAPEHGFFVRAVSIAKPTRQPASVAAPPMRLFTERVNAWAGLPKMRGWAAGDTPWFGANPDNESGAAGSLVIPPRCVGMHPGIERDVAACWQSPLGGRVRVAGKVAMADSAGGVGVNWRVVRDRGTSRMVLDAGAVGTGGTAIVGADKALDVQPGDVVSLIIGAKNGAHACCTTIAELTVTEAGGAQRIWSLTRDVLESVQTANPHADASGAPGIWQFATCEPQASAPAPSEPPFSLASSAKTAKEFIAELRKRGLKTIRTRTREHAEQTWEQAVRAMQPAGELPPIPKPPFEPAMQVDVPDEHLAAQWKLGAWHILRHSLQGADGTWRFNDFPFGILSSETYMILRALDLQGMHKEAADGLDQWLKLPLKHQVVAGQNGHHTLALPDRPLGHFSDGDGALTHAEGIEGWGGHMDAVHAMGPGAIAFAMSEHFRLTGDMEWLRANLPRMQANAKWILRQRQVLKRCLPGGERLWSKGLQPAHVVTPDSMSMHMQFFESEAYYWLAVKRTAEMLSLVSPQEGARMAAEAEAYRKDLVAAIDRAILLTPVTPVRDGTYRSFIPFAPYMRGFAAGAWGWKRCQGHVGAIYWDTVQSADPLVSPSGLIAPSDPRVQGHLDVLEDRLLLENTKVLTRTPDFNAERDWFSKAGWQYQCGLERHANIHLAAGDAPCFLRSMLNQYAVDIMPGEYTFREHTTGGPPDKIYEESCFLERFRQMLIFEDGDTLRLMRATPRDWLRQGKRIAVRNAPTRYGTLAYEVHSRIDEGVIEATIDIPSRNPAKAIVLHLRTPGSRHWKKVTVNPKPWVSVGSLPDELTLVGVTGKVQVRVEY